MEMNIRKELRINEETQKKIKEIIKKYPHEFTSMSQVIRSSIHFYHNKRCKE